MHRRGRSNQGLGGAGARIVQPLGRHPQQFTGPILGGAIFVSDFVLLPKFLHFLKKILHTALHLVGVKSLNHVHSKSKYIMKFYFFWNVVSVIKIKLAVAGRTRAATAAGWLPGARGYRICVAVSALPQRPRAASDSPSPRSRPATPATTTLSASGVFGGVPPPPTLTSTGLWEKVPRCRLSDVYFSCGRSSQPGPVWDSGLFSLIFRFRSTSWERAGEPGPQHDV